MPVPGPRSLGRGVVVAAGAPVPDAWTGAPVVPVDEAVLADPSACVAVLHDAWLTRTPVVVALSVDAGRFRAPETWSDEPWRLGARFEPWSDRLHFLVWANTYDARSTEDEPIWWWARKASRLGAKETPEGPADVLLEDGTPAWIDGGPRGPVDDLVLVHAESVELDRLAVVPPFVAPSADLAPDQLAAVASPGGPCRVIAPAGSGKTRVLTERLRVLLGDRGYEPSAVLGVAYNKKAQLELEERTVAFRPRVQTLNALGFALLGRPRVLEEREVRRLVEDLVPRRARRMNTDPIGPYLEALSLVRLGLRDPAEVEDSRDDVPGLADAFVPFRSRLADMGAVDFDDQVYGAIEALLRDGSLRRQAQSSCRHLLVDEFQDLTPAHVLLLRLLAVPRLDVFGVGDDDQVIYGHAGADPAFLLDFSSLFPGAADHPLEVNYRCPVPVVDAARHLLSYNRRRVAKTITAGPGAVASSDALVVHRHAPEAGGSTLVGVVQDWLSSPGVAPSDVAVLARVGSLLLAPHVALVEAGVPVDSILRPDVLDRTGVRAALAYLRIAGSPDAIARGDLLEVQRRPSRGLPQWIEKWFRPPLSIDALDQIAAKLDDEKVAVKIRSLAEDLRTVADAAAAASGTTRRVLAVIKDAVGLGSAMGLLDSSKAGEGGSSHLDDLEALEQVADLHPDPRTFEPWLRSVFHRQADVGGVTLSTVHRVKGREWDRVAVFGVTGGIVPHRLAEDVEEERRVLHVAITRGRRAVAVLADGSRPSPFLDEFDGSAPHDRVVRAPAPVTPIPKATSGPVYAAGEGGEVEEALRLWRASRSRQDSVPAFVVLSDKHLIGIAVARPTSLVRLRQLPGIGPTKLELYGEEILEVIRRVTGD